MGRMGGNAARTWGENHRYCFELNHRQVGTQSEQEEINPTLRAGMPPL
jgi:hypothetical protein